MNIGTLESDSTHCVDLESMQNQEPKNKIKRGTKNIRKTYFLNLVPEERNQSAVKRDSFNLVMTILGNFLWW